MAPLMIGKDFPFDLMKKNDHGIDKEKLDFFTSRKTRVETVNPLTLMEVGP